MSATNLVYEEAASPRSVRFSAVPRSRSAEERARSGCADVPVYQRTVSASARGREVLYHRHGGYGTRLSYANPENVNRIFGGRFNQSLLKELLSRQEQLYPKPYHKIQTRYREQPLWQHKNVSREKARHVIAEIQDARFRKQSRLELISSGSEANVKLQRHRDDVMLRSSELMPRAKCAALDKIESVGRKYELKVAESKKILASKRKSRPF